VTWWLKTTVLAQEAVAKGSKGYSGTEKATFVATVATNFAQAQVANQATLSATAKVLSLPTLLDYIT